MSPETQTSETDFSVDNQEFGREYEPIMLDNESDPYELPALEGDEYEIDPIKMDLQEFKGGHEHDWELKFSGDGYTFDGEHIRNNETGDAWPDFSAETIAQLRVSEFVRLDDIEIDGKLSVTYLIKGPDNSIRFEIHETAMGMNEDEEALDTFGTTPDVAYRVESGDVGIEASENLQAVLQAVLEPSTEYAHAEIAVPEIIETIESIAKPAPERIELVSEFAEQHTRERDKEHTNILSELLMERLPAFNFEETDVVVLKAPESTAPVEKSIVHAEEITDEPEVQVVPLTRGPAPVASAPKIERIPEDAIVQINRPHEVAERFVEQPIVAAHKAVEKPRESKMEMRTETKQEIRPEIAHKTPKKPGVRRGREFFRAEYRALVVHNDNIETTEVTQRSVAETAVIKMLERFAPDARLERESEVRQEDVRETPSARLETAPQPVAAPVHVEHADSPDAATRSESRETVRQEEEAVSFEAARDERLVRAEIEEVLAAHGISRTSAVELAPIAPQEGILSPLGRRPQVSDAANDNDDNFITSRNGIIMRRAA